MYAAVVSATLDPEQMEAARENLQNQVVPMVKAAPGYVAGYWLEPKNGKGMSVVLFETEDQARSTAPQPGDSTGPGVTIESVDFREVVAGP